MNTDIQEHVLKAMLASLLATDLEKYDYVEMHGVQVLKDEHGPYCVQTEEGEQPDFYGVYFHYDADLEVNAGFGGLEHFMDFETEEEALFARRLLMDIGGWDE